MLWKTELNDGLSEARKGDEIMKLRQRSPDQRAVRDSFSWEKSLFFNKICGAEQLRVTDIVSHLMFQNEIFQEVKNLVLS